MSCYGCNKRHTCCWDTCEDYKKEKAERDERNARIRQAKDREQMFKGCAVQAQINFKTRTRRPATKRARRGARG